MQRTYRIGQIVPSSNTTMETEIPAMLRAREQILPERFSFHASRMRMQKVTKEELAAMDRDSDRCALELSDGKMDVMGYACLVAIMSMGLGYHRASEKRLHEVTVANGKPAPVVSSAGALVEGLKAMGAKKVSVLTPYMKPLTQLVVDYIEHEGIAVHDSLSLEIADNLQVGAQPAAVAHGHPHRAASARARLQGKVQLGGVVQQAVFQQAFQNGAQAGCLLVGPQRNAGRQLHALP